MKKFGILTLALLSHLPLNALAQSAPTSDKKVAAVTDIASNIEIKRGPLADFYELVAQYPSTNTSSIASVATNNTVANPNPNASVKENKPASQTAKTMPGQKTAVAHVAKSVSE